MANWLDGTVVEKKLWTDRLISLRIDAPLGDFRAGQFVRVALDIEGEQVARPYSLVNAPDEALLEIFFNIVQGGVLSTKLAELEAGDVLRVADNPSGFLTINEVPEARNLWLLATGTGIGPFLSSLKTDEPWQRFENIVLAYSVRTSDELCYLETISKLVNTYPEQMQFVPFVTREKMQGAVNERITTAIADGELERRVGLQIDTVSSHIMMCGNSQMITEVTELLAARGLRKHRRREPGHITTEKYH